MDLETTQIDVIRSAFERGLRSNNLEDQPAPWLLRGLKILEEGGELTIAKIKAVNASGGTDHPDPWFG